MLISCITVAQPGRLGLLRSAVADFAAQTHAERELVVVHDGDREFDAAVRALCEEHPGAPVGILAVARGAMLGAPRYPEVARGEDTALCLATLGAGHRIASLRGIGGCDVYVCHGGNAWSLGHHAGNSSAKSLGAARLLASERILRARLAEYRPSPGAVVLPHAGGQIEIG